MKRSPEIGSTAAALADAERLIGTEPRRALPILIEAGRRDPANLRILRLTAAALRAAGEDRRAEQADREIGRVLSARPKLVEAARALAAGRIAAAERLVRDQLAGDGEDVAALRILADVAGKVGRVREVHLLLSRALHLAPGYAEARFDLAVLHYRQSNYGAVLPELDRLLAAEPGNPAYLNLKAEVLGRVNRFDEAVSIYEDLTGRFPDDANIWLHFGNLLRIVGRQEQSVRAYRRTTELAPSFGPAWWSLANLKTFRLDEAEVDRMSRQLDRADLDENDRAHLHFALGKAFEDRQRYDESAGHYEAGNRLRRAAANYRPEEIRSFVDCSEQILTKAFFEERSDFGAAAADPIFIIGMPRSGSTLVEQILASHGDIEGTAELAALPAIARQLAASAPEGYPACLATLTREKSRELGEQYLAWTRPQRHTSRALFIDKNPNNWMNVGLIQMILPNAKIIDVRRHPLGCCFSNYKQLFARAQGFTYGLTDLGRYYSDYVRLLAHMDEVLPGRAHRVFYEDLIADVEAATRSILTFIGLEFDPSCLLFYDTERAIRTPSSEQVRQPINDSGLNRWRAYERWLEPLKEALGPVLSAYPEVPSLAALRSMTVHNAQV